jgi:NADPH2:quinone reductase
LALAFRRYGGPEVIEVVELPMPGAGPGEVVVEVVAATVNPTDLMMRSGAQASWMTGLRPPYVPGMEFSGRVHELGEGVRGLAPGQHVMGLVDARRPDGGAQAQFIRVPQTSVVAAPDGTGLVEAATVPMNGVTADLALELLGLRPGAAVLVTGAAGALGGYSVQLAKVLGLVVIADAWEADEELVTRLGADVVVPRGEGMAGAVRNRFPAGVDGAIDAARIGSVVAGLVRDGGGFVGVRSTDAAGDDRIRRTYVSVLRQLENTNALLRLRRLVREGRLTPRVAVPMPMMRAAEAHALLERGGQRRRVVLELRGTNAD